MAMLIVKNAQGVTVLSLPAPKLIGGNHQAANR